MGYLNAVIEAIDEGGHIASFRNEKDMVAVTCKRCGRPWPCAAITKARQTVRRLHGIKVKT